MNIKLNENRMLKSFLLGFLHEFFYDFFGHKIKNNQYGGSTKNYKFENHEFTIDKTIDEEDETIIIKLISQKDENINCFMVAKSKNDNYAIIQNLEYNPDCAKNGLPENSGKIILGFLIVLFKALNIN